MILRVIQNVLTDIVDTDERSGDLSVPRGVYLCVSFGLCVLLVTDIIISDVLYLFCSQSVIFCVRRLSIQGKSWEWLWWWRNWLLRNKTNQVRWDIYRNGLR